MEKINFMKSFDKATYPNSFIAYMKTDVTAEEEVFEDLSKKLNFPDYFRFNWDAVWDLIRDLSWISERNIVLVYSNETELEPKIQDEYFKLLIEASEDWNPGEDHSLQIVFPDSLVNKISELSNSSKKDADRNKKQV